MNQELSFLSSVDGLTGNLNRRCFDQFLAQQWSLAARNGEPIALIMCDIDFFKAYNDSYGHLQGDECLKKVASALKTSIPYRLSSITPNVTISLGVAISYANYAVLPQTLLRLQMMPYIKRNRMVETATSLLAIHANLNQFNILTKKFRRFY